MQAGLHGSRHPMLAAVLTVSLTGQAWAESAVSDRPVKEPIAMSEELELLKEEETISIASRYEQPISQAPSNVYVVTDEDIRQSGAIDLPTILRRVPGLEVMQTTGADFNVSVRGDNQLLANKVLVLVDGRSIYVDAQGNVNWKAIPITLPEIKRIEVLKGPASAVYGFNAFDGVINIITKSPEEMKGTTLQFGGGELGTISSAAVHAGTIGKFGYRLSLGRDQTNQWRDRDSLAFRSHKFNAHTEYSFSDDSKVLVSGGLVDVNRFDQITELSYSAITPVQGYANVAYERPNFFIRSWWMGFNDTTAIGANPLLSNIMRFTDRDTQSFIVTRSNTYNAEIQHAVELWDANRFTYGANYRHISLSSNFISQFSTENRMGLYVQDEWKALHHLTIVAGLRYDMDTFINPTISPRVAVLYQPIQDHSFQASMAIAYRPPTLFESHLQDLAFITLPPPLPSPPPIPTNPSPNLEPEKIVSYQIGYQGWLFKHRLRARMDLFFNHITNLINFRGTSATNDPGQADIYGGEAGIEFLAARWLTGFANYAYEEIGQSFTDTAKRGAPRHKWNVGFRGEWEGGLSAEGVLHHVGAATYPIAGSFTTFSAFLPNGTTVPDPRVGSYNFLNLRAGYRFWQEKAAAGYMRDAEVAVSVFNALNDEHKEHPLGDLIGRRVMGWITVRF